MFHDLRLVACLMMPERMATNSSTDLHRGTESHHLRPYTIHVFFLSTTDIILSYLRIAVFCFFKDGYIWGGTMPLFSRGPGGSYFAYSPYTLFLLYIMLQLSTKRTTLQKSLSFICVCVCGTFAEIQNGLPAFHRIGS